MMTLDANEERTMMTLAMVASWAVGGCISAELLGYFLHRLLHSGAIGFLSRSHMRHHLALYGPLQNQRSRQYLDATAGKASLGNIGAEWFLPAALLIAVVAGLLFLFQVRLLFASVFLGTTLLWSFLMFSFLHDAMHVDGIWLERSRWLKRWFASARRRHDIHHCLINDEGLMEKNFGIGFFLFDRVFGTLMDADAKFNHSGYRAAQERFKAVLGRNA